MSESGRPTETKPGGAEPGIVRTFAALGHNWPQLSALSSRLVTISANWPHLAAAQPLDDRAAAFPSEQAIVRTFAALGHN